MKVYQHPLSGHCHRVVLKTHPDDAIARAHGLLKQLDNAWLQRIEALPGFVGFRKTP
jgi:hypothetical protein